MHALWAHSGAPPAEEIHSALRSGWIAAAREFRAGAPPQLLPGPVVVPPVWWLDLPQCSTAGLADGPMQAGTERGAHGHCSYLQGAAATCLLAAVARWHPAYGGPCPQEQGRQGAEVPPLLSGCAAQQLWL